MCAFLTLSCFENILWMLLLILSRLAALLFWKDVCRGQLKRQKLLLREPHVAMLPCSQLHQEGDCCILWCRGVIRRGTASQMVRSAEEACHQEVRLPERGIPFPCNVTTAAQTAAANKCLCNAGESLVGRIWGPHNCPLGNAALCAHG